MPRREELGSRVEDQDMIKVLTTQPCGGTLCNLQLCCGVGPTSGTSFHPSIYIYLQILYIMYVRNVWDPHCGLKIFPSQYAWDFQERR